MKVFFTVVLLFVFSSVMFGQDFMSELENSMERSKGGSGVKVEYKIHLTAGTVKSYYASKFDEGKLIMINDVPVYFELTKVTGEEKETIVISISEAIFMEFEVFYVKGNCNYRFDFFY